jgi:hypothetical protein
MTLSFDDYQAINEQIAYYQRIVHEGQLAVSMSQDMMAFKEARLSLDKSLHPALDITVSSIPDGHGRWIAIRDAATQDIVGVTAARLFENESLPHLLHARLIWGDREHPADPVEPMTEIWSAELNDIRGRLVFGGGAYLDRRLKGQDVGKAMAGIMHAVCLRLWDPDYFFNLMLVEKLSSKVPPERFGYRHTTMIYDQNTRPDWGPSQNKCEIANWKSRWEELEGYGLDRAA